MFDNLDLALALLSVSSGLTGLTLVSTSLFPLLAERAKGRYEVFVTKSRIHQFLNFTKLAFALFTTSVLLSLLWCFLLASSVVGWSAVVVGVGSVVSFLAGLGMAAYMILGLLQPGMFTGGDDR